MGSLTIPIILTVVAIIIAVTAYRGVRRGATRFYTLEREAMLRRASYTLLGSILLFLVVIVLLMYNQWPTENPGQTAGELEPTFSLTATEESLMQNQPPTPSPTPTTDPNIPTPTPTPVVCRAIVDGTAGSGLTLRSAPGGGELSILPDGTILNLLEDEPTEANGFIWRKVRTVSQEEGWVVESFLKIGECQ